MMKSTRRIEHRRFDGSPQFIRRSLREAPALEEKTVQVWVAALNLPVSQLLELWHTLAPGERERALRFRSQKDCDRFIAARGLLRLFLGRYLQRPPGAIVFSYNPFGKPALAPDGDGAAALQFNLSHAGELAVYAFAKNRLIGIDVEHVRPDLADDGVAERFFSPDEVGALRTLAEPLRVRAFFNCWTRKEAYIKARGEGLSLPLDGFDVSLAPDEPAQLLGVRGAPEEAARWSLHELSCGPHYVAALAVEGAGYQLECWQWAGGDGGGEQAAAVG